MCGMKLPPGTRRLTTARQIDAVGSPLRQEILEHLSHTGPAAVADLARLMGRRPTVLHYHVNLLRGAGLIQVAARRRSGRRTEALYRLAARRFAVLGRAGADPSDEGVASTLGATLRLAQRDAIRAIRVAQVAGDGPGRNLHMRRHRAPLTAASLREVNRLLDRLERIFVADVKSRIRRGSADPDRQIVALTLLLSPAARPATTPARTVRKEHHP
jgi:DNA-binding transcriptional ArsR family regulator